jgi:VIT family protein
MAGARQSGAETLFVIIAAALAGMFSMAIGSFLSSKAELEVARGIGARETEHTHRARSRIG